MQNNIDVVDISKVIKNKHLVDFENNIDSNRKISVNILYK